MFGTIEDDLLIALMVLLAVEAIALSFAEVLDGEIEELAAKVVLELIVVPKLISFEVAV